MARRLLHQMRMTSEPFAIQLFRRFVGGSTIQQLSSELGIPADRVETRIRAAAVYFGSHRNTPMLEEWQTWS